MKTRKFLFVLMSVAAVLTSCNPSKVKEDITKYPISTKERIVLDLVLDYLCDDYSGILSYAKSKDKKIEKIKETRTRTEVIIYVAGTKSNNISIETKDFYDTNEKLLSSYRTISLHEHSKIDSAITRIEENGYTRYYSVPLEKTVTHKTVKEYNLESRYCSSIEYFFEDKLLWTDSVIYTLCGLPLKLYQLVDNNGQQLLYQCFYDEAERLVGINGMDKSGCKCNIKYKKNKTIIQFTSSVGQKLKYSLFYDNNGRIAKLIQPDKKTEYTHFDEYDNWIECKSKRKIRWWLLIEDNAYREILYYED